MKQYILVYADEYNPSIKRARAFETNICPFEYYHAKLWKMSHVNINILMG